MSLWKSSSHWELVALRAGIPLCEVILYPRVNCIVTLSVPPVAVGSNAIHVVENNGRGVSRVDSVGKDSGVSYLSLQ